MKARYILFAAAIFAMNLAARADTFDFSMQGTSANGLDFFQGVFTTTDTSTNGFYTITGISDTVNDIDGDKIPVTLSLLAPGTLDGNNNEVSLTSPYVNGGGIGFTDGTDFYNLYDFVAADNLDILCETSSLKNPCSIGEGNYPFLTVTDATTSATAPEPSCFALLGTGLLGVCGVVRRRLV